MFFNNFDPFLWRISENFGVRWYGLSYIFGFVFCYFLLNFLANRKKILLSKEEIPDFIVFLALGTMLGGRLGYCFFYEPSLLTTFTWVKLAGVNVPVWEALAVWRGGMASHGGILGMLVACLWYAKIKKVNSLHLMDLTCLAGPLAVFFGRITNFINGELYGRACEGSCVWPVLFPKELERWVSLWDKEKLASLYSVVERMGSLNLRTEKIIMPGETMWKSMIENKVLGGTYKVEAYVEMILYRVSQNNQEIIQALTQVLTPRHPSQLYQSLLEGLLVFLILFFVWKKPQKPGLIVSLWGMLYAGTRIIGEQFRMPDAHIGYDVLGLTRGQWLSLGMLIGFFVLLLYVRKKSSEKIGGWGAT